VGEGSNGLIENLVTELSNPAHIFADYEMNASKEFLFKQCFKEQPELIRIKATNLSLDRRGNR